MSCSTGDNDSREKTSACDFLKKSLWISVVAVLVMVLSFDFEFSLIDITMTVYSVKMTPTITFYYSASLIITLYSDKAGVKSNLM